MLSTAALNSQGTPASLTMGLSAFPSCGQLLEVVLGRQLTHMKNLVLGGN